MAWASTGGFDLMTPGHVRVYAGPNLAQLTLEDGRVRNASHTVEQGVGIRAMAGEKTGVAYADEIAMPSLLQASDAARTIARGGRGT